MNTKILSYILAIAEDKSISKAAERFYLAQPVLSMHLKKLETELGAPLFSRTKAGMIPTRAGVIFLNDARAILHRQQQLEDQLEKQRLRNRNTLRFMVDRTYYSHFVRFTLPLLRKAYPAYQYEITSCNASQARRALSFQEAEVGIFTEAGALPEAMESVTLMKNQYLAAFSPDYRGKLTLDGIRHAISSGFTLVLHDIGSSFRMLEEEHLAKAGILPPFLLEQHSFLATISMLKDGGYCSFLPKDLLEQFPDSGIRIGTPLFSFEAVMAYPPGTELPESFFRLIADSFSGFAENSRQLTIPDA